MTTPTIEELLDKARFEAWLRDRNPSANVGESQSTETCPIACYLKANGFPDAWVGGNVVGGNGGTRVDVPMWVSHFTRLVDSLRDSKGNVRDHVKVRAYQAWAILGRTG